MPCRALPSALQVLDDFAAASPEEREEEYEGGTPYSPFVAMLQVSLQQGGAGGSSKESKGCYLGCMGFLVTRAAAWQGSWLVSGMPANM